MISAPSEIRCIGMPLILMVASVAKIVSNRIVPMTVADLKPMKMKSVTITMTSAATTLTTKF